jgi:cytoskeleton protein RodZ
VIVIAIAAVLYLLPSRMLQTVSAPGGAASAVAPLASAPRVVSEPVAPVMAASAPLVALEPPAAAASAAPAAPTPTLAADVATPPPSTLHLRTSEPSWIEVQDNAGRLLISRVVEPGESVDLDGTLPLKLRVGNALATQVVFRGQPVDLARHTRENIARLELK